MSNVAIRVENLGKQYRLGEINQHKTLRETLTRAIHKPLHWLRGEVGRSRGPETFWALRDISFDVQRGEVVGIIGRNGAGKSTLLKLLSRITHPTEGRVAGYGRVGSLLEVGTGFHPELTGRENVYLNGAVLGMKREEINRKFDEIVAFSEVEKFLDTPVKHYSSGMYVRLAFSVAAHLEPEILIVDEVLAVGDASFQKKCLGKMHNVARSGRTVLFVSHNMMAVEDLCGRTIWLDGGRMKDMGPTRQIVSRYLNTAYVAATEERWPEPQTAPGNDEIRLHRALVRPAEGEAGDLIDVNTPVVISFEYWNQIAGAQLNINLQLYNEQGVIVFEAGPSKEPLWQPLPTGLMKDTCLIPAHLLNDGTYTVTLQAIKNQGTHVYTHEDILTFVVQDSSEQRGGWYGEWAGVIRPQLDWDRAALHGDALSAREGSA